MSTVNKSQSPESPQATVMAAKYAFPYHHLANVEGGTWRVHRHLNWGYEYLGYLAEITAEIVKLAPKRLLEVGCGDGRLMTDLLNTEIDEVHGIDIDQRAIHFAKAFNFENAERIYAGDVRELDAGRFDTVVAVEVLEHIPEAELPSIVRGVWDRTLEGSHLVVSVPTTNVPVTPAHFRHYDTGLLQDHLAPYFEVTQTRFVHTESFRYRLLRRLALNRLFLLNETRLLRLVGRMYRSSSLSASSTDGHHLIALAKRVDETD